MASLADFNEVLDKIDADIAGETADIASLKQQIADLQGQIGGGGLTAAEEEALLARLTATEAALKALEDSVP